VFLSVFQLGLVSELAFQLVLKLLSELAFVLQSQLVSELAFQSV
jgi:hypothetical protein